MVSSCDPAGNSGRGCPDVFLNSKYFANLWGEGGALGRTLPIASVVASWDSHELWPRPFSCVFPLRCSSLSSDLCPGSPSSIPALTVPSQRHSWRFCAWCGVAPAGTDPWVPALGLAAATTLPVVCPLLQQERTVGGAAQTLLIGLP